MLGKAGSLEGADTDMGDNRGRGCPLLGGLGLPVGGLDLPVGGLGTWAWGGHSASWWPGELPVGGLVGLRIVHEKFFGDTFADFLYGKSFMGLYVN